MRFNLLCAIAVVVVGVIKLRQQRPTRLGVEDFGYPAGIVVIVIHTRAIALGDCVQPAVLQIVVGSGGAVGQCSVQAVAGIEGVSGAAA